MPEEIEDDAIEYFLDHKDLDDCLECGGGINENAQIEIIQQTGGRNGVYSKEPYRVVECEDCSTEYYQMMSK